MTLEPKEVVPATEVAQPATPLTEATPPTETALTRAEVAELISKANEEVSTRLKADLDAAYKAARRSEAKGDTANAKLAKMEARLEEVATRGMDEGEARLWKAQRAEERAQEASSTVTTQRDNERAFADWNVRAQEYLRTEGITAEDPVLIASFNKNVEGARTYDDYDRAMSRAVADVHKDRAKKATDNVKVVADKAREEERARLRNEQRRGEGPVDRGSPASPASKPDWKTMTDEEFKVYDAQRDADRKARQRGVRTS